MKKILFISPVFPDPNGAGREKRAFQWVKRLQEEHEVHMLVIAANGQAKAAPGLPACPFLDISRLTVLEKKEEKRSKPFLILSMIKAVLPLLAGRTSDSPLLSWVPLTRAEKEQLRERYEQLHFDQILCFRLYLSDYAVFLQQLTHCRSAELDLDDIESSTHLKLAKLFRSRGHAARALLSDLRGLNFSRREKKLGSPFESVYLCSEEDKQLFHERLPQVSLQVMPNRISGYPEPPALPDNPYGLLFVGSLDYFPNEEAVTWFIQEVLPRLRKRNPRWVLHVAGHSSRQAFRDLLDAAEGVHYYGRVEHLEEIYAKAYQVISPLHAGGGTKLKILEAMWYGRPIIATYESVHGLGLTPYRHYLPAEDADSFISGCERAAADAEFAQTLARQSREVLLEKYYF
ncbi:glycosyltransferase [Paenibacillus pinistramenti]|uniref:glycosyltransferase n=1 Tax=Paenibacillus pinistramenti TaxID=1768003 RepID=UPI001108AFAB|nr:glycosyltransferase family 4 protein [Paenibacillus pinistramenti]